MILTLGACAGNAFMAIKWNHVSLKYHYILNLLLHGRFTTFTACTISSETSCIITYVCMLSLKIFPTAVGFSSLYPILYIQTWISCIHVVHMQCTKGIPQRISDYHIHLNIHSMKHFIYTFIIQSFTSLMRMLCSFRCTIENSVWIVIRSLSLSLSFFLLLDK